MNVVEVDALRRLYFLGGRRLFLRRPRRTIEALRNLSFAVRGGELFGLLGPNGAGKTTTIKVLATLLLPTSGRATVLGVDVARDPGAIRRRIGILFGGDRGLYGRVSAWHNLRYFANLYGLPTWQSRRRIDDLLAMVGLSDRAADRVDSFSRGMKQRLHIARVLLHDPEVIFLDEPTIGLDPIGAREVRDLIRGLHSRGRTILLTTHYMFEADELCDRVGIIDQGQLIAIGSPSVLRQGLPDLYVLEVELFGPSQGAVEKLRVLSGDGIVDVIDRNGTQILRLQSRKGQDLARQIPGALSGERLGSVVVREPTLEDVYIRVINDSRKQPPQSG